MLVVDYAPRDRSRVLFYDEDIGLSGIRLALSFSVVALLESNVLRPISPSSFMSEGIVVPRRALNSNFRRRKAFVSTILLFSVTVRKERERERAKKRTGSINFIV